MGNTDMNLLMILGRTLSSKWVLLVLMVVISTTSAIGGYKLAKGKYETEKRIALEAVLGELEVQKKANELINDRLALELENVKQKERIVIKEVYKYVEANPDTASCNLDADGMQLWNSTLKADVPK